MKELTEGMALLFESALEPVIGTDGENIVLMNPAAVSAFGDHRGAEFSALLPEAVRSLAPGQVAAVTLCGKRASLRAASAGGLTVYFAAVEAPAPALPERAGFLPELRSLLSALKLAADRLSESAEAAGDAAGTERSPGTSKAARSASARRTWTSTSSAAARPGRRSSSRAAGA